MQRRCYVLQATIPMGIVLKAIVPMVTALQAVMASGGPAALVGDCSCRQPLSQLGCHAKSAKPVTLWYQSGTSIRRNTRHTNVGDIARLYGGQPTRTTFWGKRTLRSSKRSRSEEQASRLGI
ncbi:hypothetical protein BHM03_00053601 [Ensete ventricosum]|nr:hypothetical protein BHM03_00053601 [Ensete ventricosum]